MTKTYKALYEGLKLALEAFDEKIAQYSVAWAQKRAEALREFKKSEEYNSIRRNRDTYKLYGRLHAIAGGKTWYDILNGRSDDDIAFIIRKNCALTSAKRNAGIASKLDKVGITQVTSTEYGHSRDGFDCTVEVNTNDGPKVITVNTITAGGWNIQCFHLRVLIKVR